MSTRVNVVDLSYEIWRNRVLSQLSVTDLCRLDTAVQNRAMRSTLHRALSGTDMEHETILTPEIMEWIVNKGLKLLQIKVTEDVTTDGLLHFAEYCPQIRSIDTCDFHDDVRHVQKKSRVHDDNDAKYYLRKVDEAFIATILLTCKALKILRLSGFEPHEWWDMLPHIIPLCAHLEKLTYKEPRSDEDDEDEEEEEDEGERYYTTFSLTRTTLYIAAEEMVNLEKGGVFEVALLKSQITTLKLDSSRFVCEEEVLAIARCCPSLEVAILNVCITNDPLEQFYRLCPKLTTLHLLEFEYFVMDPDSISRSISLLHDLKSFSYFTSHQSAGNVYRAVVDALGSQLHTLGVQSTNCMSMEGWEYVLQKCPNLRTIESEAGYGTGQLRVLARRHGVRIENA